MKKKKKWLNKRNKPFVVVIALLILIGIGYAILRASLSISGILHASDMEYDVHFENARFTANNTLITATLPSTPARDKLKKISFNVNFDEPGQIYEFLVDIKNTGTLDAIIENIDSTIKINDGEPQIINDEMTNIPDYFEYSVEYENGDPIDESKRLISGGIETIKISLKFKEDISQEQLDQALSETPRFTVNIHTKFTKKTWDTNPVFDDDIELVNGATYESDQYLYTYYESEYNLNDILTGDSVQLFLSSETNSIATPTIPIGGGWHVRLKDDLESYAITDKLKTSINNRPIISTAGAFAGRQLESIDLSDFYTGNVISMAGMFALTDVDSIDVSNFDTSKVKSMTAMFYSSSINSITGLDHFNTSKVLNMNQMFHGTGSNITTLDLSSFDTSSVIDMSSMFGCYEWAYPCTDNIQTIYASNNFVIPDITGSECAHSTNYNGETGDNNKKYCNIRIFYTNNLVGGNGTPYNSSNDERVFGRIDAPGTPGYFTAKN